jgi:very-short-patch-repair endonuclease
MSLAERNPDLAKEWHPTKNLPLTPETVSFGSGKEIWWLCDKTCPQGCKHEWKTAVGNRNNLGSGCPFCSQNSKNLCIHTSIITTHPEIAKEWHPTKNGDLKASDFGANSNKVVWWLCSTPCSKGCIHEWESRIGHRTQGVGCPYCSYPQKKLCIHTSLEYTHPEVAKQWHPTKNEDKKPSQFTPGSGQKVWWLCKKNNNHEWKATIDHRTKNRSCPYCSYSTESILLDFLKKYYQDIITQLKLDSCKNKTHLPFDFFIPSIKTIIELDGIQHFKQVSNWASPKQSIKRDIYKMQKAIAEGYKIIRIFQEDVYDNDEAWLDENLLPEIQSEDRKPVFISTIEDLYDEHIALYEKGEEIILDSDDSEEE